MTRGWAVWVLSVGLLASACGGRAADRGGPGNHTGSSSAGGGSAGVDVPGGGGESEPSAGASSSGFAMLSASEWNVRIQFKLRNPPQHILDAPNCGTAALTLDVFDDNGVLKLLLGGDGSSTVGFPSASSNDSLTLGAALTYQPRLGPCSLTVPGDAVYTFNALQLRGVDANNDGVFERIEGSGDGDASYFTSASSEGIPLTFTLSGTPDDTAPTISGSTNGINPLDSLSMMVSEPLETGQLFLQGDPVAPLVSPVLEQPLMVSGEQVLPFGHTWHVAGSAADYAGLPLKTGLTVSTVKDPGVFAQDGFEGPLAALLTGGAQIIDKTYGVAVTGNRALLIPPDGSATLHLAGSTHENGKLTVSFRKLFGDANMTDAGSGGMEAGAIGEAGPDSIALTATGPGTPIDIGQWHAASAPSTLVMPLSNPVDDEIVRITASSCGGACPPVALVIDDLKLE